LEIKPGLFRPEYSTRGRLASGVPLGLPKYTSGHRLARGISIGMPEYARQMPNVHLTACPVLCICSIACDHQCAKGKDSELCFHHDFSPVMSVTAQV
jgi:hypothetical protein